MVSSTPSDTPGVSIFGKIASTTAFKNIIAGLIAGTVVIGGNQVFNTVNNATPKTQVTDGSVITTTVKHSLTAETYDVALNGESNGTSTGLVLNVDGETRSQTYKTVCTATGGIVSPTVSYATCLVKPPISTTGALLKISLECGATDQALTASGGFVKTRTAAVLTAIKNFNAIAVGTGAYALFSTGSLSFNPADFFKIQVHQSIPANNPINCNVYTTIAKRHGV